MKEWYLRQSPRDRIIVLVVGFLTIVGSAYAFVWEPLQEGLATREQNVINQQRDLQYMVDGAARIKASGGTASSNSRTSDKAPYLLIDELIRKGGLTPPQRVEPTSGGTGARVTFNEVGFDKLVQVIAELELYGMSVSTINISRKGTGTVSARFTMEKG